MRNLILSAAPMMQADTGGNTSGAPVASAGQNAAGTPNTAPTADATGANAANTGRKRGPRKPAVPPVSHDTLDAIKAATLGEGMRRYSVTDAANNRTQFVVTNSPEKALAFTAEKWGIKVVNIDNPAGTPGRKPTKSVEEQFESLPEAERNRILSKYLSPAQIAALNVGANPAQGTPVQAQASAPAAATAQPNATAGKAPAKATAGAKR